MTIKVTVISGGRADWGLLSPVCAALQNDQAFDLRIVATGQHLMDEAASLHAIEKDGFKVDAVIDMGLGAGDNAQAITQALGRGLIGFAQEFAAHRPDLLLILGDRYEILGAVQAALLAKIPVAHICGGDITEGAIDDSMRHAITKLSHIHFTTNEQARTRIVQMGENSENVHCVGNPGLDHIHDMKEISRDEFFKSIEFTAQAQNILVTFHPVTLENDSLRQCQAMLGALEKLGPDVGVIITGSNADPEGQDITRLVQNWTKDRKHACFYMSLGSHRYLNALRHVDAMVGNSSSGLYEAPSFGLAAVNIGDRQKGRLRAATVIDCSPETDAIYTAIQKALRQGRGKAENPYGDGHSAERITAILKKIDYNLNLCKKIFLDQK